ncbi:MAG: polysaccharide export protein EpsE, partial [Coraliomargarita sp. TMED73]
MKNIYLHKVILFLYFVTTVAFAEESETLSTAYLLSPVDKLTISVYGQPDLQSEQRISDAGTVSIPLLGEIIIGGLTVS